jgi:hypothetical protein
MMSGPCAAGSGGYAGFDRDWHSTGLPVFEQGWDARHPLKALSG